MFIVQTAAPPIAQHLVELLIMVNAAKLASAKRITAVIPWYFYARQDKKSRPREPITARLVADLLETAGVDRVITMDLHAGQVQGFFRIPVDHMVAVPMFAQHIRDYLGSEVERVAVAPDTGRAKLAGKFAEMIGGGLVVLNKERPGHNQAKVTGVIGDVDGKVAVMTDDIIDTAGTLCAGAEALREAGATRVIACATHALFNDPALERIADERVREGDRHRHGAGRRAAQAGQRRGALDLRPARGDDPERLLRRLRVSDLRRREPALLIRPLDGVWRCASSPPCRRWTGCVLDVDVDASEPMLSPRAVRAPGHPLQQLYPVSVPVARRDRARLSVVARALGTRTPGRDLEPRTRRHRYSPSAYDVT